MVYVLGYLLDLMAFGALLFRFATADDASYDWYLDVYPSLILIFIGMRLVLVGRCKDEVFIYSQQVLDRDKDWYLIFGYGSIALGAILLFVG